jgi:murein L,D-transpeptidase YcbB/YkuD
VVGKAMNKTVILVPMKYIVFRPYWNVPTSIQEKILPAIEKNPLGRTQHGMEDSFVRQGPKLIGISEVFFNSNAIYLHDTPSKVYLAGGSRF